MGTASNFTGPLKNLIVAKKKEAFWKSLFHVVTTVITKAAMGLTYGPMTPMVRMGVMTMKMFFPKIRLVEDDDVNGNPRFVEDLEEDQPTNPDATPATRTRTYGFGRLRGGGGGGGGGDDGGRSYAQVNLLFPDLAQIATAVLVMAGLYLAYRA